MFMTFCEGWMINTFQLYPNITSKKSTQLSTHKVPTWIPTAPVPTKGMGATRGEIRGDSTTRGDLKTTHLLTRNNYWNFHGNKNTLDSCWKVFLLGRKFAYLYTMTRFDKMYCICGMGFVVQSCTEASLTFWTLLLCVSGHVRTRQCGWTSILHKSRAISSPTHTNQPLLLSAFRSHNPIALDFGLWKRKNVDSQHLLLQVAYKRSPQKAGKHNKMRIRISAPCEPKALSGVRPAPHHAAVHCPAKRPRCFLT